MNRKTLWNNTSIECVEIDNKWFALFGWNGEQYNHCWLVNEDTTNANCPNEFTIKPIYKGIGEQDTDGVYEEYSIVGYEII